METLMKQKPQIVGAEKGFKLVGKIVANHDRAQYFRAIKLELVSNIQQQVSIFRITGRRPKRINNHSSNGHKGVCFN